MEFSADNILVILGLVCVAAGALMTLVYLVAQDRRLIRAATVLVVGVGVLFLAWITSTPDAMDKIVEKIALGAVGIIMAAIWWVTRRIKRK